MRKDNSRIIAIFFLTIFFPAILPLNLIYASNNGPVAPEAASFEAIDSTDMVNLSTGDLTYVLPLMDVQSPEGGYPLSLSYHAGIAMDQEASWVGLGWSLNPGSINRSVQGFPDDWAKTRINSLIFDRGETKNYYDMSIGGTLPNGVTLGMSKSWGAYKAWGGCVGYAGVTVDFGSEGVGMGVSMGPVSYHVGANGASIGVAYVPSGQNADTGQPINANGFGAAIGYNTNSGFSGSVFAKRLGTGISFNSDGASATVKGVSINKEASSSVTKDDYYTSLTTKGFNIDVGFFWAKYQHTRFKYSLYINNKNFVCGTLNLFDTNNVTNYIQDKNYYMDVREYHTPSNNQQQHEDNVYNGYDKYLVNGYNIMMYPKYDNYFAAAQGLSGSFSPRIFDQVMLYNFGEGDMNVPNSAQIDEDYTLVNTRKNIRFLAQPTASSPYKLNNKLFFYFDNVNSSFLRTQSGGYTALSTYPLNDTRLGYSNSDVATAVNAFGIQTDPTFSSPTTPAGDLKRSGNRKRDGHHIEAFTNQQIQSGQTQGWFMEADGFDRASYTLKAPNGVGGYRITSLDGKVYHYSLPVYHYEEVTKNYSNANDENDKFYESVKTEPYATHWLVTAITGPDYVDANNNGKADAEDYGYWVNFEYGKWSEGYGWRSPKVGAKAYRNNQTYFWGRKEIYYLDKIKTRTHTALFVKSIRNDDKSTYIAKRTGNVYSGNGYINRNVHAESFYSDKQNPIEQGIYYTADNPAGPKNLNYEYSHKEVNIKYVDLPVNYSLRLDKILLLKNEDASVVNKARVTSMSGNRKRGYSYFDQGFFWVYEWVAKDPYDIRKSEINTDQNVLDVMDIAGLNLENKALKAIDFGYDYSLGNNLPNAVGGRLALKTLTFKGNGSVQTMPPYRFAYNKSAIPYNKDNTDVWGYVKDHPDAWSLSQITNPMGAYLKIAYESDSYFRQANFRSVTKPVKYGYGYYDYPGVDHIVKEGNKQKVYIMPSVIDNLNDTFIVGDMIDMAATMKVYDSYDNISYKYITTKYVIEAINDVDNYITLATCDLTDDDVHNRLYTYNFCNTPNVSHYPQCITSLLISKTDFDTYTISDSNGKKGGGVRVKDIETHDGMGNIFRTEYNYRNPVTNRITGVTSYEPFDDEKALNFIEELPSPEVVYNYVTVTMFGNNHKLNKTQYEFKVLENFSVDNADSYSSLGPSYRLGNDFMVRKDQREGAITRYYLTDDNVFKESFVKNTIFSNLSSIGSLLSVKTFNVENQLVKHVKNNYKQFEEDSQENGIIQESFSFIKKSEKLEREGFSHLHTRQAKYLFGISSKVEIPTVLESVTTKAGGYSTTVYYDKHDFLTGKPMETRTETSDGRILKNKIVPAYRKYPQMGSKADNVLNRNMLAQPAIEIAYVFDKSSSSWKETGVGISTWNNNWVYKYDDGYNYSPTQDRQKIWRKHKTYNWNGTKDNNGLFSNYDAATDDSFNWTVGGTQSNPKWKQLSEITRYDHFSMPIELKDVSGNLSITKMGDNNTKVVVTGNAGSGEIYSTGAEYVNGGWYEQEIKVGATLRTTALAHTGRYSVGTNASSKLGVIMKSGAHRAGRYKLSVWVHKNAAQKARVQVDNILYDFNGEVYPPAGDWVLKTHYLNIPAGEISVNVTSADATLVYYDDFRLHPVYSSVISYVYNEWDELSYIIGDKNLGTKYTYDESGKLTGTFVEVVDDPENQTTGGFKRASKINYHYKGR